MIKNIFVVAGHGKNWYGATDCGAVAGNLTERAINIKVARELTAKLKKNYPKKYIQSIGVETEASIKQKQKFLKSCIVQNGLNPDECLALHLHCNAHSDTDARGVECYASLSAVEGLAGTLTENLANWFSTKNRGAKKTRGTRAEYIENDACPALLLEMGFLSNLTDRTYLLRPRNLAESILFILKKFI